MRSSPRGQTQLFNEPVGGCFSLLLQNMELLMVLALRPGLTFALRGEVCAKFVSEPCLGRQLPWVVPLRRNRKALPAPQCACREGGRGVHKAVCIDLAVGVQ